MSPCAVIRGILAYDIGVARRPAWWHMLLAPRKSACSARAPGPGEQFAEPNPGAVEAILDQLKHWLEDEYRRADSLSQRAAWLLGFCARGHVHGWVSGSPGTRRRLPRALLRAHQAKPSALSRLLQQSGTPIPPTSARLGRKRDQEGNRGRPKAHSRTDMGWNSHSRATSEGMEQSRQEGLLRYLPLVWR